MSFESLTPAEQLAHVLREARGHKPWEASPECGALLREMRYVVDCIAAKSQTVQAMELKRNFTTLLVYIAGQHHVLADGMATIVVYGLGWASDARVL